MDIIFWSLILYVFRGYYPHFEGIICIGHIKNYLAHNVCHVIKSFVLVMNIIFIFQILNSLVLFVDIVCIGNITSYLACNVRPIFHIYLSSVND